MKKTPKISFEYLLSSLFWTERQSLDQNFSSTPYTILCGITSDLPEGWEGEGHESFSPFNPPQRHHTTPQR